MTPTSMWAAVLHGPLDLRLEERPVPRPGPGEVLVEVRRVGVCGSDIHYYADGGIGATRVDSPMVLGHEAAGVVAAPGPGVTTHAVGDRVSIEPGFACGVCEPCRTGRYNLCTAMRFFATPPVDGAFAEYVVVPVAYAHHVPDALSDDAAALLEPLSVGVWACRRARVGVGDRVLVTGGGPVGLIAAQVARAAGAAEVVVTDVRTARLEAAARLGFTALDGRDTGLAGSGLRPDVLLECSGHPGATREAVGVVAPAGRVVLVGIGGEEVALPTRAVLGRELWLTGVFRYAHTWPAAIDLCVSGRVDLDSLVTGHFPLTEAELALTAPDRDPGTLKPVVVPTP